MKGLWPFLSVLWAVGVVGSSVFLGEMMLSGQALAQVDPGQLGVLGRVQDTQDQRRLAAQQAALEAQQQAVRAQRDAEPRARAKVAARLAASQKKADALFAQEMQEKASQHDYLEQNRVLDLEQRRLQLKMEEAKAHHADDFVKVELKRQDAEVDRIATVNHGIRVEADSDAKLKNDVGDITKAEAHALEMKERHWWHW